MGGAGVCWWCVWGGAWPRRLPAAEAGGRHYRGGGRHGRGVGAGVVSLVFVVGGVAAP